MVPPDSLGAARDSLEVILGCLERASFVLPGEEMDRAESERRAVVQSIRGYVLPRLREPDAPLVAVLVGLSGVGKSTLLNSLAQDRISEAGSLRPTTINSVIWAHRDHAGRYWTEFVGKVKADLGPATDIVIGDDPITTHLTFVDTPPMEFDQDPSVPSGAGVSMFGDIAIFVSSTGRYADSTPFERLRAARDRGLPILFVLNRLPPSDSARRELLADYAAKLTDAGMLPEPDPSLVFAVDEGELRWHGGLGPEEVRSLRQELGELSDPEFRELVVDETTETAVRAVARRAGVVADHIRREAAERSELTRIVQEEYAEVLEDLSRRLTSGEYAELAGLSGFPDAAAEIIGVVTKGAGGAAQAVARRWTITAGHAIIEPGFDGLRRHGPALSRELRAGLSEWRSNLEGGLVGRLRRRRIRRVARELWRKVLDSDHTVRRRVRRAVAARTDEARHELIEVLASSLIADAERFHRRLGGELDVDLARQIDEAVDRLVGGAIRDSESVASD